MTDLIDVHGGTGPAQTPELGNHCCSSPPAPLLLPSCTPAPPLLHLYCTSPHSAHPATAPGSHGAEDGEDRLEEGEEEEGEEGEEGMSEAEKRLLEQLRHELKSRLR